VVTVTAGAVPAGAIACEDGFTADNCKVQGGVTRCPQSWKHGDFKQRTDGSVAVISSIVLLALALEALRRYDLDFQISADCQERSSGPICSDSIAMTQHNQNAATLLQIWSLMVFGQIIPLLSILKDTLNCWLKPTPWQEIFLAWTDNWAIRRDNQRRTQQPDHTVQPEQRLPWIDRSYLGLLAL
jgi:hypothetical protein